MRRRVQFILLEKCLKVLNSTTNSSKVILFAISSSDTFVRDIICLKLLSHFLIRYVGTYLITVD